MNKYGFPVNQKQEEIDMPVDNFYMLQPDGRVIKATTLMEYIRWQQQNDTKILRTYILPKVFVSTVFLGLDHDWFPEGKDAPVVFESMVFGGQLDGFQERYRYLDVAKAGHWTIVKHVILAELWARVVPFGIGLVFTLLAFLFFWWGWG